MVLTHDPSPTPQHISNKMLPLPWCWGSICCCVAGPQGVTAFSSCWQPLEITSPSLAQLPGKMRQSQEPHIEDVTGPRPDSCPHSPLLCFTAGSSQPSPLGEGLFSSLTSIQRFNQRSKEYCTDPGGLQTQLSICAFLPLPPGFSMDLSHVC